MYQATIISNVNVKKLRQYFSPLILLSSKANPPHNTVHIRTPHDDEGGHGDQVGLRLAAVASTNMNTKIGGEDCMRKTRKQEYW